MKAKARDRAREFAAAFSAALAAGWSDDIDPGLFEEIAADEQPISAEASILKAAIEEGLEAANARA